MKTTTRKRTPRLSPRRFVTTLGDLVSAAYDAADGFGEKRVERAKLILTRSPLARAMSPHVRFV
ncbi:hypothetical protein [Anaeromyxobacter paludicola]|uniref:Uncharacterized protein n=1 Tax=Anaeromyxobacter paludicola TaxID=2918171 RepID=A0ABN6NAU3_9BACT|nr:hypothetical protein [Anaeromyxobacter paludicola]BDG09423.1 hypothetical protein AMPC_25360 [Anaeromyxobacter paludicola]